MPIRYPTHDRNLGRAPSSLAARWDSGVHHERRRMSLTKEEKHEIIKEHGRAETDTGSPEVQIAMLTRRINQLT
jgi:hypothetical protein